MIQDKQYHDIVKTREVNLNYFSTPLAKNPLVTPTFEIEDDQVAEER